MKKIILAILLTTILLPSLWAGSQEKQPPKINDNKERFINGQGSWRAFANANPEERRNLMDLQRRNPEEFRKILRPKAEEIYQTELERCFKLKAKVAEYQAMKDEEQKAQIKKEIITHLKEDYTRRLNENKRQLAELKARAAKLEAALNKREKKMTSAIEAHANGIISGKIPVFEPGQRRKFRPAKN